MLMPAIRDPDLAAGLAGAAGMLAVVPGMPNPLRVLLGVPLLLFWPGFAVVRAVLPRGTLSRGEMLLAGLGVSMALSVCAAVLLGASVGLSGLALAAFLGGITVAASAGAWSRQRSGTATGRHRSRGG
jgi:uncharacterized membrane protein